MLERVEAFLGVERRVVVIAAIAIVLAALAAIAAIGLIAARPNLHTTTDRRTPSTHAIAAPRQMSPERLAVVAYARHVDVPAHDVLATMRSGPPSPCPDATTSFLLVSTPASHATSGLVVLSCANGHPDIKSVRTTR
ncbi:MAG: hypothetical protein ACYCS4_12955 [Acidimicrobiales bacterium]